MAAKTIIISRALSIALLISFILIAAYPVLAEDATDGAGTRKEKIQQKIEARKEKIENRVAAVKEKVASREAALQAKLQAFKDKRKAEVTEKVSTNLNRVNQRQTEQMLNHLDKMSSILNRLESRVNNPTADIKDVNAAKDAISKSREMIASASTAATTQAAKDYTIQVTSESKVKTDAKSQRDQLHKDLKAVRQLVIEAKQSVGNAISIARSGVKAKEGTTSGQQ